jgi:hypothetical protein
MVGARRFSAVAFRAQVENGLGIVLARAILRPIGTPRAELEPHVPTPEAGQSLPCRHRCGLPEKRVRDPARGNRLAYLQSLWPGSWTLGHLQSAFPSISETKRIETAGQLYVGKLPV